MSAKIGGDMQKKYSFFSKIDGSGVISNSAGVYHANSQLKNLGEFVGGK